MDFEILAKFLLNGLIAGSLYAILALGLFTGAGRELLEDPRISEAYLGRRK